MAPPSPPPSSPSWVILSALPRVGMLENDADVSLLPLEVPPRVTLLTLAPRVFPDTVDPLKKLKLPFINATDPSGLLLAVCPSTPLHRPPSTTSDSSDDNVADEIVSDDTHRSESEYLVLDLRSATATRVHDTFGMVYHWANLGVIAAPAGAPGFVLVEFDDHVSSDKACLTCFSSQTDYWHSRYRFVNNPLPPRNISIFDDVISHDAKVWWVDSAAGLLACDPFADKPEMFYVPLPVLEQEEDDDQPDDHTSCYDYSSPERKLRSRRRVQVSNGKFRCVDVTRRARQGQGGIPTGTVTMRTLSDPETAEWTLEYEVRFDEISGMPRKKAPVLIGLIHPENPDVLYFFVTKYLIGVDMRARKLVECQAHQPLMVGAVTPSSVLPLVLPPAIAPAGLPAEVADNDAKEDEDEDDLFRFGCGGFFSCIDKAT